MAQPGKAQLRRVQSGTRRSGLRAALIACKLAVCTLTVFTLAAGWLLGAEPALAQTAPVRKFTVVATTGMIADAARNIGGSSAEVSALFGPGVDPHGHRTTQTDIASMTRADLVLWNGLYLEAQMEGFLRDLARRKPVVAVAEALPKDILLEDEDNKGKFDPHLWMDTSLWSRVVAAIKDAMIAARPDARDTFEANATRYLREIETVGAYAKRVLATVPADRRVVVSAHDAFNYFGKAHGYEVVGIQGISTESEAGLAKIRELVELVVTRTLPAIFVETSVSDRNIQAVIEGAQARRHGVKIGGELFSDALGDAGTYEGTYVGMVDHNVTTVTRALGGEAPARGMQGKLAAPKT